MFLYVCVILSSGFYVVTFCLVPWSFRGMLSLPVWSHAPSGGYGPSGVQYTPPRQTSNGGHRSGRYASYWNALLFPIAVTSFLTYLTSWVRKCNVYLQYLLPFHGQMNFGDQPIIMILVNFVSDQNCSKSWVIDNTRILQIPLFLL